MGRSLIRRKHNMTFRDLVTTALGNLWRMKLRSTLTLSGIVIAIAAFVAMLSFGAGMQQNIAEQFDKLGLLSIIQVYPENAQDTDSNTVVELNNAALEYFGKLPGVELVYPYESLELTISFGDSEKTVSAQALPSSAIQTKLFSNLAAGTLFTADSSREIMISDSMREKLGIDSAESILNKPVVISIKVAKIDSGVVSILDPISDIIKKRRKELSADTIHFAEYARTAIREELGGALNRFIDGFMNNREIKAETLTVCGVFDSRQLRRLRLKDMIIPAATAREFSSSGFTGDPTELLAGLQSGNLFVTNPDSPTNEYSQATVMMETDALYEPIRDSIKAAGFRTFSFAEEFKEIRRFFRYFNLALGLIGIIALMTASLGIINTMIMSITERRREIGIWMSLGADVGEIRRLFLVESGLIGFIGALGGVIFGWIISRIGSFVAKTFMENEGVPPMEIFHIPIWLVLTALIFGVFVSLLAGYYPANRAAKIDPVVSLRNE
ncbi:MAG: ABC transporter permease [candidate division Zixibacteria bacterium]|nr:ABC transporter permease [candidate division Zixibacteria bacterium]